MFLNYAEVEALIRKGKIRWAFDIGLGRRKRAIRILAESLLPGGQRFHNLDAALLFILPGSGKLEIPCIELGRIISCTRPHVMELCRRGMIVGRVVRHERLVSVASARQFLAERHLSPKPASKVARKQRSKMPQDDLAAVLSREPAESRARTNGSKRQRPCSARQTPDFSKGGES
ncbi:hypothetical protein GC207_11290 [bacterium]|nr:hypothetical protein [bacterium]